MLRNRRPARILGVLGDPYSWAQAALIAVLLQQFSKRKGLVVSLAVYGGYAAFLYGLSLFALIVLPFFYGLSSEDPMMMVAVNWPLTTGGYELAGVATLFAGGFFTISLRRNLLQDIIRQYSK